MRRVRPETKWIAYLLVCAIGGTFSTHDSLAQDAIAPPKIVDFERHIAPLFGRLGCNSAACHGAFRGGKGGLQLSLFGHSVKMDYQGLQDRIDLVDPASSLLLEKPSGRQEHEGGVRFETDSHAYKTIKQWIEQGAAWNAGSGRVKGLTVEPEQVLLTPQQESRKLTILAEYLDGTTEDITHLCQFSSRDEGVAVVDPSGQISRSRHGDTSIIISYGNAFAATSVLVPYPAQSPQDSVHINNEHSEIDQRIDEKLALLNVARSAASSDEEFLRRVTLDTIGTIPKPEQVVAFCNDTEPHKRERIIDELLSHPMHAALWATRMCDITKCDAGLMGDEELIGVRRAQMWHDWFRKRFEQNVPYDKIVHDILTATSREGQDVSDWIKEEEQLVQRCRISFDNDYTKRETLDLFWRRANPDREARLKENAELIAVAMTGIRLNCAQCHKHPFDRWTQDDYAAFANIFSRVVYGSSNETNSAIQAELTRRREAKRTGQTVEPLPRIREVFLSTELGRALSGTEPGIDVAPRAFDSPRFRNDGDVRERFHEWLIQADNPYFAKAFVNRIWAIYFGIGLVDPVDDFSVTNPPSHPRLLEELAQRFRESSFDIRSIEKRILMSATYQRSSTPNESNRDDRRNFARQHVRPLLAEVMLDSLNKMLGTEEPFGDSARAGSLAIEVGTNLVPGASGRALQRLGRGKREGTCDCDRRVESDLRQFLFLANDASMMQKIKTGSIRELLALNDQDLVLQLYLRAFGRKPDASEHEVAVNHLNRTESRETAFDDLVWAFANAREFLTNH